MEIQETDIIRSLAGRDCGNLYMVVSLDPQYAYLADGKGRSFSAPKKKSRKHIEYVAPCDENTVQRKLERGKITNSEIRKALSALRRAEETCQKKPEEVVEFGKR